MNVNRVGYLVHSRLTKPWLSIEYFFNKTKLSGEIRKLKEKVLLTTFGTDLEKLFHIPASPGSESIFGWMKNVSMSYEEFLESTYFFAGPNITTTSFALANTLFLLGMNHAVQEKLYCELKAILTSSSESVNKNDISKMSYLDLVIKEGMRLLPTSISQARKVMKPLKLKNFMLPEGTNVFIPTLEVHTDEKLWGDDVLEFKPERFKSENFKKIHPYSYIPFSQGPRICPGVRYSMISMKIFLSRFLMEYKVSTDMKYNEIEFLVIPGLTTKQPMKILCEKRVELI